MKTGVAWVESARICMLKYWYTAYYFYSVAFQIFGGRPQLDSDICYLYHKLGVSMCFETNSFKSPSSIPTLRYHVSNSFGCVADSWMYVNYDMMSADVGTISGEFPLKKTGHTSGMERLTVSRFTFQFAPLRLCSTRSGRFGYVLANFRCRCSYLCSS